MMKHYDTAYWAGRMRRDQRPWNRFLFGIRRRLKLHLLIRQRNEMRSEYIQTRNPILRDVWRELDQDIAAIVGSRTR
jgi:hypothetical protein